MIAVGGGVVGVAPLAVATVVASAKVQCLVVAPVAIMIVGAMVVVETVAATAVTGIVVASTMIAVALGSVVRWDLVAAPVALVVIAASGNAPTAAGKLFFVKYWRLDGLYGFPSPFPPRLFYKEKRKGCYVVGGDPERGRCRSFYLLEMQPL